MGEIIPLLGLELGFGWIAVIERELRAILNGACSFYMSGFEGMCGWVVIGRQRVVEVRHVVG